MTLKINTKVLSLAMLLLMLALTVLPGCYYDDGPFLSFRSTKGRIANQWAFSYAERLGTDVTAEYSDALLQLSKDGGLVFDLGDGTIYTGDWTLSFDRKLLTLVYADQNDAFEEVFVIMRLKDDQMWLQQEIGEQMRWELIPD